MAIEVHTGRSRYKGLTKRLYKKQIGASSPGSEKGELCKATSLDKAMAKYPRAHKVFTVEYIAHNKKKDRLARRITFFTNL